MKNYILLPPKFITLHSIFKRAKTTTTTKKRQESFLQVWHHIFKFLACKHILLQTLLPSKKGTKWWNYSKMERLQQLVLRSSIVSILQTKCSIWEFVKCKFSRKKIGKMLEMILICIKLLLNHFILALVVLSASDILDKCWRMCSKRNPTKWLCFSIQLMLHSYNSQPFLMHNWGHLTVWSLEGIMVLPEQ